MTILLLMMLLDFDKGVELRKNHTSGFNQYYLDKTIDDMNTLLETNPERFLAMITQLSESQRNPKTAYILSAFDHLDIWKVGEVLPGPTDPIDPTETPCEGGPLVCDDATTRWQTCPNGDCG